MATPTLQNRCAAKTLIEMLVLLSLLTMLLGALLPVLGAARQDGRRTDCLESQRVRGGMFAAWAADHDGRWPTAADRARFPADVFAAPGYDRRVMLRSYLPPGGAAECPASGAAPLSDPGNVAAVLRGSYAYYGAEPPARADAAVRLQDVLVDAPQNAPSNAGGAPLRFNHGLGTPAVRAGNSSFGGVWGDAPDGVNTLFADGRARWVTAGETGVQGWASGMRQLRVYGVVDVAGSK